MKKLILFLFIVIFTVPSFGQFSFSGDARFRPRYDIKDFGDFGGKKEDFYYMYWVRLNVKADIGDGWFFKTRLGHNGYGGYGFTTGLSTDAPLAGAVEGSMRPTVDFMELYFGRFTKKYGYIGGIVPLNGVGNPVYDVHYYPGKLVDVPFFIYSVNAAFGMYGYISLGKNMLNLYLLADKNEYKEEDINGDPVHDFNDTYTVGIDYEANISGFKLQPMIYYSFGPDDAFKPFTYGLNLIAPKVGGFTFSISAIGSNHKDPYLDSNNKMHPEYSVMYLRVKTVGKLGVGTAIVWLDLAKRTDKPENSPEVEDKFSYLWVKYNIPVYKSKTGSVTIGPTVRLMNEKIDGNKDYTRAKIEITTQINF